MPERGDLTSEADAARSPTGHRVARSPTQKFLLRQAEDNFATSVEDGMLIAGGLIATIGGALSLSSVPGVAAGSTGIIVGGVVVACVGKSAPSLARELRDSLAQPPDGPPPTANQLNGSRVQGQGDFEESLSFANTSPPVDPSSYGDPATRALEFLSDLSLLLLGTVAGLAFLAGASYVVVLSFVGAAFLSKAAFDLAEDAYIVWSTGNPEKAPLSFPPGTGSSRGGEDIVFLFLGLSTILIATTVSAPLTAAGLALGVGALGKALPSAAASKPSGS